MEIVVGPLVFHGYVALAANIAAWAICGSILATRATAWVRAELRQIGLNKLATKEQHPPTFTQITYGDMDWSTVSLVEIVNPPAIAAPAELQPEASAESHFPASRMITAPEQ